MANITSRAGKAPARAWIGLGVIALPCVLYSMDLTVLNLAVPHLTADLAPSAAELLWIVDIYGFMIAGALITMGTLGDRVGRRRLLLIGAAVFGAASAAAAFSTTPAMLIATRALLGLAGATLAPSTLSLIRNMFEDEAERRLAIGVWIASFSAGAAVGPLVGGLLLQHFWWGSVFLANVPIMVLLLILGPLLLPEYRDPDAGRLDVASAAQSLVAVLAVIWGLKRIAEHGIGPVAVAAILAGAALAAVFLRRQRRLADPLVDLSLFRNPAFCVALAVNVAGFFFMFGIFLFTAQYLQLVVGLSPFDAGLWSLPSAVAFIAGSLIVPAIVARVRTERVMAAGLVLAAAGFAVLTRVDPGGALGAVVVGSVIFSLGFTPVVTLTTDIIVSAAPPERAGAAAALSETSSELGGALGIALLGSIATAIYRGTMAGAPVAGAPEAIEAARATLGGAVATAAAMPPADAASLVAAARDAFTAGMQLNAAIAVLGLVATAVLAAGVLGRARPPDAGTPLPRPDC